MRSLQEALGRELLWQPRSLLSRTYDLVEPESPTSEPFATLTTEGAFYQRPRAEAESAAGVWRFRARGFLREQVLISAAGADSPLATFRRQWRRGVLRLEGGKEFVWRRPSFWSFVWAFEDQNDMAVVRFRSRLRFPRATTVVQLGNGVERVSEAPLLACLGWYLLLLARRHRATSSGI